MSIEGDASRKETGEIISKRAGGRDLLIVAFIFLLALTVRSVYLYEISKGELFDTPVIDSATYLETAKSISSTGKLSPSVFWQSFFYPLYLASMISLFDGNILIARILQLIAGSVSAVLVFMLGKNLFDRRSGVIAGLITALYGPLFFFEAELLATGWAAFIAVVVVYLFCAAMDKENIPAYLLAGAVSGFAVTIRATFLPFTVIAMILIFLRAAMETANRKRIIVRNLIMAAAFLSFLAVPAALSNNVTGNFSPLPKSGSLNLYIGNNSDTDRTIMIRPGHKWRSLIREPLVHGYSTDAGHRRYFMKRFTDYLVTDPGGYAAGIIKKTVQFFSSREIPRNIDVYTGRKWSTLLSLAVWKIGIFGFPFGVLLPLAVLGLFYRRKGRALPLRLFLLIYPLSIIAVFVSSRYRVVIVPIAAVAAGAGLKHLIDRAGRREWRRMAVDLGFAAGIAVLTSVAGPFAAESYDYESELYASAGYEQGKAGELEKAEKNLRKSLELSPDYLAGHRILGNLLNQKGEFGEAEEHFRRVLKEEPGSYTVQYYIGISLWRQGKAREALVFLESAEKGAVKDREMTIYQQIQNIRKSISDAIDIDAGGPERLD